MPITTLTRDWRRFHDAEGDFIAPNSTVHCVSDASSIIELCRDRPASKKYKSSGSHWALSTVTVSDDEFIETNWPGNDNVPRHSGLDIDLFELIDDGMFDFMVAHPSQRPDAATADACLTEEPFNFFFVHLRSGTRVYEAYSFLDGATGVVTKLAQELNNSLAGGPNNGAYAGPWGFRTLGGAGGQTVFGALTTGTHGGDYRQRPISDSVMAVHLVTDGGAHFWVEPASNQLGKQLTDDNKLRAAYETLVPGMPFEIIRDDDVFHSVTVGAGRFGVVSSFVARVVPQYSLHEHRRLDTWPKVKTMLNSGINHHRFDGVHFAGTPSEIAQDIAAFDARFGSFKNFSNRFLQIAINLSPDGEGSHICGVSQRWFYPQSGPEATDPDGNVRGRKERGTTAVAGKVAAYVPPDDDTGAGGNSTFLTRACSSGNFIAGVLRECANEIDQTIADGAVPAGGIAVGALAIGGGAAVLAIASACAILALVAVALRELADAIEASGDASMAGSLDKAINTIVNNPAIPHDLAIMIIRAIFYAAFKSQQKNRDFVALSYAVMDTHDYTDRSCFSNAESIEVFFDATRPDIYCAYVDAILAFEAAQQEREGKFSVGYVSLRYVQGSLGLIAPSRFDETVVMEVAGLRDASGSVPFVMNAAKLARHPMFNASFHWGQFNPLTRAEVERHYGNAPNSRLDRWRNALDRVTNGSDGFSSAFTRQTGLEP
ncbi:MAG: hypothetical protein QOH74_1017 [Gaiellales bacterium]|jgi:hypothetical protein|nr:hypothetical protein [Gaiellales bacterium]